MLTGFNDEFINQLWLFKVRIETPRPKFQIQVQGRFYMVKFIKKQYGCIKIKQNTKQNVQEILQEVVDSK